jgi:hypothetical protein
MSEWQPIESAPRDACVILLCVPGAFGTQWVGAGWYDENHDGWWEVNTHYSDAQDGQIHNPTHWMLFPPPPETHGDHDGR